MKEEKFNNSPKQRRILVAPLDWGLGHATRCIPIIRILLKHNTEVLLAAQGATKKLLENEFPQLKILPLEGYNISYSRHKKFFSLNVLIQLPKVFSTIRKEKKWLDEMIRNENIDGVISDNRPGLHHASVPSIYITHQLQIQTGNKISDTWVQKRHYHFINKFQQCWIPDNKSHNILGGDLSHPKVYPAVSCKYLGVLSRFTKMEARIKYEFLLLLSGPEPQRSIFEEKLLQAFDGGPHSFALVRGMPLEENNFPLKTNTGSVFSHLRADELNELIASSSLVIARSGYSTVMDMIRLQKKAVLIATPGQTEQEYLATYLQENKLFASLQQEEISLENIRLATKKFDAPKQFDNLMQEAVVTNWLESIKIN